MTTCRARTVSGDGLLRVASAIVVDNIEEAPHIVFGGYLLRNGRVFLVLDMGYSDAAKKSTN